MAKQEKNRNAKIPTLLSKLLKSFAAVKEFFLSIGDGKATEEEESFREMYSSFRESELSRTDSFYNTLYIKVSNRLERSKKTVSQDRGAHCEHPLGWMEKSEREVESPFWKFAFSFLTALPRRLVKPFSFLKRLFSTRNGKDNVLCSATDALRAIRKNLCYIIPAVLAVGAFWYMASAASADIVIGAKVGGSELGLIQSVDMLDEAVDEVEKKASNVLGRSFKFPYEVSYYFSYKDNFLTPTELYSALVGSLSEYIMPGYGLYVDDRLVAALKSEEEIGRALTELVSEEQSRNQGTKVALVNEIRVASETFPAQKITDGEHLKELLLYGTGEYSNLTALDEIYTIPYQVCSGITLSFCNSIGENALEQAKNNAEALDFTNTYYYYDIDTGVLGGGDDEPAGALVTFSYSKEVTTVGDLDYDVKRVNDPSLYVGGEEIQVSGKKGKAIVRTRLTYVNGELVKSDVIDKQIFQSPVTQVVGVGAKPLPEESVSADMKVFILPKKGHLNSGYGWRDMDEDGVNDDFHSGLDIESPMGSNIYASLSGTVVFAGEYFTYGNLIRIKHDNGYETYYAHLDQILVKEGEQVRQGQLIGLSGNTGFTTGPHFHFELRKPDGEAVDPLLYVYE